MTTLLRCPKCSKSKNGKFIDQRCQCGGPLEFDHRKGKVLEGGSVWHRYKEFYNFEISDFYSLGEGDTSLSRLDYLSSELDLELYAKNETTNPTWSFKDRGTFLGVQQAVENDFSKIGTVSTGNMAASIAAYGARFGLDTYILVSDDINEFKLSQVSVYGPKIYRVDGDYGKLYFRSLEMGENNGIYFINSDNPYRVEGYKTIGFEIVEEMLPDHVLIPTSSGGLFRGIVKSFIELKRSRIIQKYPRFTAVQAEGCSPIYDAFKKGKGKISLVKEKNTLAKAIANPYPPSGNEVLRKLNQIDGTCVKVSDEEIIRAQDELATEGIFAQLAGCVGIAAVKKMKHDNMIKRGEKVVSIITGSGLKISKNGFKDSIITDIDIDELETI
ncbi:MAG: threonine synthase [Candidatus Saliniplasma sp.]